MQITERRAGDLARLKECLRRERNAEQRDRLLSVVKAIEGRETLAIAEALSRSRAFVQRWAYAYRDGGIDAVAARKRGGNRATLRGAALEHIKARLDAGPTPADKVCAFRAKDVQRIAKQELKTDVSLSSVYRTLHRLGYSCLAPRPRHEKQDPEAQRTFREHSAPLLSGSSARPSSRSGARSASSSWTRPGSGSRAR
jgi:transposase